MMLTIYIPTYKRHELRACLESITPQLNYDVEVWVSDNDPERSAQVVCDDFPQVKYRSNHLNIGADGNCLRGMVTGRGDYVWVVGDDDLLLPGAVEATLGMCDGVIDRIIHVGDKHGEAPFGFEGTMAQMMDRINDKSFIVASTLCTMNVWRRSVLDPYLGLTGLDTRNVLCWAGMYATNIVVPYKPFVQVGRDNLTFFPHFGKTMEKYLDVLQTYDLPEQAFGMAAANHWNYNNV